MSCASEGQESIRVRIARVWMIPARIHPLALRAGIGNLLSKYQAL